MRTVKRDTKLDYKVITEPESFIRVSGNILALKFYLEIVASPGSMLMLKAANRSKYLGLSSVLNLSLDLQLTVQSDKSTESQPLTAICTSPILEEWKSARLRC